MKALIAFTKKELTDHLRSFRLMILAIIFVIFGIMNPAVAKLTPILMDLFSESLAQTGIILGEVTVTAMDSWVQFFKNIPMALIIFILLEGSIFTKEYGSTLVLALTKGLRRSTVVISKTAMMVLLWTVGYWVCFGITWGANAYYWDNSIAQHLFLSGVCWWLFGLWTVSVCTLFSTIVNSGVMVYLGTGGIVMILYLMSIIPKVNEYLPTMLMDGPSLIYGLKAPEDYIAPIVITTVLCVACFAAAVPIMNKRQVI